MRRYRIAAFAAGRASDVARAGEYLSFGVAGVNVAGRADVAGGAFVASVTLRRIADNAAAAQKRFRDKDLQQARAALLQGERERARQRSMARPARTEAGPRRDASDRSRDTDRRRPDRPERS